MGLLERALKYKKQINETGRETLIDRIKGPAESGFNEQINSETVAIHEIDDYTLPPINEISGPDNFNDNYEYINIPGKQEIETSVLNETITQGFASNEENNNFYNEAIVIADEPLSETKEKHILSGSSLFNDEEDIVIPEFDDDGEKTGTAANISDVKLSDETNDSNSSVIEDGQAYHMPEFNDYAVLYEMLKEFTKADSIEEIFGAVIFSIMGQLGVSSVSIISPSEDDSGKWIITDSTGIKIPEDISWEVSEGILEILNSYRGVLDVEDLKNDISLRDDYYRFISVNARLITPIVYSENLSGVVLVGEKIDSAEFTPAEMEFLSSLSEAASSAIEAKIVYEKANTELLGLRIEKEILWDVDIFQNSILSAGSVAELEDIIRKNFYSLGIESYTLFLEEESSGDFYPAYFENEDYLEFADSGFRVRRDNRLVGFLQNRKASIILDNFAESNVITETFGRNRVDNMSIFIAYPFIISGRLSGFISIYKINAAVEIIDVDIRLQRIVRFIFPYISRLIAIDPENNRYNDLTGSFYSRLERELKRASDMNIPVAVISFSIKNYKRYFDRFGKFEMLKMFDAVSEIIKGRLAPGDFSARVGRNKYIIVLPGKDRKYCASFTAILKNEIANRFNTPEFRLLISFISSIYPDDGEDIFSLLEIID